MLENLLKMYKKNLSPEKKEKNSVWSKIDDSIKGSKSERTIFGLNYKFASFMFIFLLIGVGAIGYLGLNERVLDSGDKKDDWQFDPESDEDSLLKQLTSSFSGGTSNYPMQMEAADSSMGFSTGGAKDINNFRENIENGYLPLPTDITYEGLFYDYYFDTGQKEECTKLFCPSYSYAVSKDPVSEKDDYYIAVGLNSGMKESDFQRKKLNLVIVMDISGSMGSAFDTYYYDQFGNQQGIEESEDSGKSKMQIANEAVVDLLGHLNDEDRFGMVLFDDVSYLAKPLNLVGETDMQAIKDHVLEIQPQGGTNMEAGMKEGTDLFDEYLDVDKSEYENRIIFLTDAMPNTGDTSEEGLLGMTQKNSDNKVYTTFIGVGVDFNTELIESITKIRGANYYSVHSSEEFKERMDEGFDYMVTPLVFNLLLELEADGFDIEKVYGSPEANEATGEIMKVNTLFPSKTEGGETRGGLVLLKLKKIEDDSSLNLKVSYEDREGNKDQEENSVELGGQEADYYENSGIRKGILLARYADLIKNWIQDERLGLYYEGPIDVSVTTEDGIVVPGAVELGEWERQSVDLNVSEEYKELFVEFKTYFESEMSEIGDDELSQEVDIMEVLLN